MTKDSRTHTELHQTISVGMQRIDDKLDGIGCDITKIELHLKDINGRVQKNTIFSNKQSVINTILGVIGSLTLAGVISILFSLVIK